MRLLSIVLSQAGNTPSTLSMQRVGILNFVLVSTARSVICWLMGYLGLGLDRSLLVPAAINQLNQWSQPV